MTKVENYHSLPRCGKEPELVDATRIKGGTASLKQSDSTDSTD